MVINQLKAGAALSYVLLGLNTIIGLLYTPFLLRMLGKSEYGLYSLAASVIAYLTVLDLGFGNAIVRYTAKFRAEGKREEQYEMFGMFFLLYLGISAIAFIVAMALVWKVDAIFDANMTVGEVSRMRIILLLMAFNLAFTFPMSIWGSIITAYEDFVFQKLVNIARTILNPVVMIVLLYFGYKAIALVVVTTLFNVLTLNVNHLYCKRKLHVKLYFRKFRLGFLKEVSIYSFWIFLNAIMDRIYWSSGQFILGIYQGTASVAVYAVAIQLKDMYFMFSTAISSVFLPRVTSMVTKGASEKEISDLFIRTGRIQYLIMAFIFIKRNRKYLIYSKRTEARTRRHLNDATIKDNYLGTFLLVLLVFARSAAMFSLTTFLPLYFMHELGQKEEVSTLANTIVAGAGAVATLIGGPMADRFGFTQWVRFTSVVCVPFGVLFILTHNPLLSVAALIPLSLFYYAAMSPIVVIGQKMLPQHVGMATGITIGLGISFGGIIAPVLGNLGDKFGLDATMLAVVCLTGLSALLSFVVPIVNRPVKEKISA